MMKINHNIPWIVSAIAMVGCGSGNPSPQDLDNPSVRIVYQSDPLADVQVRLHAKPDGPVLTQAISSSDGVAHFRETPSPEPAGYFVSLASLGDGGWILDTKFLQPATSGMTLKKLAEAETQLIEIPRGAVRPLQPKQRR